MSDPESLEALVRAFTDLTKQLQAVNEQLRGSQPSLDGGVASQRPFFQTAVTVSGLTATEKRPVENISVEDWSEEAYRSLSACPGPPLEKTLLVCDVLGGEAGGVVEFSPPGILNENFHCFKSLNTLYRQFYHRRQQEVSAYSCKSYEADGKPICLRLNYEGHIASVCQAALPPEPGPVPHSGGPAEDVACCSVGPQEN